MVNPILIPNNIKNQVVLIAALDWGMGHTTRCVSVISQLIQQGNQIIFAGNECQINFMALDFPEIRTTALDGYNIQLDSKKSTYLQMARQQKSIMRAIKEENSWLKEFAEKNKIEFVISDNRYGFYHDTIPSVIITHQLNLQVPNFNFITNWVIKRLIEKFDSCWVPDDKNRALTGELSNAKIKIPVCFIGLLNRFTKLEARKRYDYLIILSGPEPERTNFLDYAKKQAISLGGSIAFVGAKVKGYESFLNPTTKELSEIIAESESVYSRAGYTTIMEMVGLEKKALLIPTKGQYEQLYLAEYIQNDCISFIQADI